VVFTIGGVIYIVVCYLIGTAILAVPVYIAASMVRVRLDGYGWAFIATFLVLMVQTVLSILIPMALIGFPIAILSSVLVLSFTLGASWPKATLILVILALMAVILGFVIVNFLGGYATVNFYGHQYSFGNP
jgi:hypothetical protein